MSYIDTNRLRHLIADGHTLAKETILDLLTRVERQQEKELRQLALDKHPIDPEARPAKDQALVYTEYLIGNGQHQNSNPILDVIQQQARELASTALAGTLAAQAAAAHPSNHDYAWDIRTPNRNCYVCGRPEAEHRQD